MGKAILMGVSVLDFWLMEVYEMNQAIQEYEEERKEKLLMWRLSNYVMARPHFDPKKPIPSIESWHPFPWEKKGPSKSRFIPYDEQIEFAIKMGKAHWIPKHWYEQSENYTHLSKTQKPD